VKQETPQSVIQTTAAKHAAVMEDILDLCRKHMILSAWMMPSEAEQAAYLKGVKEGGKFATHAILRDGNCRFEREA